MKNLILFLFTSTICASAFAQSQNERKVATTQIELFNKVANLDSLLFAAYNSKNLNLMKTYFTKASIGASLEEFAEDVRAILEAKLKNL